MPSSVAARALFGITDRHKVPLSFVQRSGAGALDQTIAEETFRRSSCRAAA